MASRIIYIISGCVVAAFVMNTLSTANSCLNWITLFSEMNEIIIEKNYHQTYSILLSVKQLLRTICTLNYYYA